MREKKQQTLPILRLLASVICGLIAYVIASYFRFLAPQYSYVFVLLSPFLLILGFSGFIGGLAAGWVAGDLKLGILASAIVVVAYMAFGIWIVITPPGGISIDSAAYSLGINLTPLVFNVYEIVVYPIFYFPATLIGGFLGSYLKLRRK
jgi:hypothetical protein